MTDWYTRIVRELCNRCAVDDWQAVVAAQQIEANGYTVSLFPHPDLPSSLVLYAELTHQPVLQETELLAQLLMSNIGEAGNGAGAFGLIPGRGTAAFCTTLVDANRLSGDDLMKRILDLIAAGTARLHGAVSRQMKRGPAGPSNSRYPLKGMRA